MNCCEFGKAGLVKCEEMGARTERKGGRMEERVYKTLKKTGASNLVIGILIVCFGIAAGVTIIVNGAKLLARKSDILF